MGTILVSWLGRTDLRAVTEGEQAGLGPVVQALQTGRFERLELICDYAPGEAAPYLAWLQGISPTPVTPHYVTLPGPTDFGAIYQEARRVVAQTVARQQPGDGLAFNLSPGTPAMAAVWIILAKTRFPAELIESSLQHGVRTASAPFDIAADFLPDLLARPDRALERLAAGLPPEAPELSAIVHRSPVMQRVVARARRVAPRSIPVLIEGQTARLREPDHPDQLAQAPRGLALMARSLPSSSTVRRLAAPLFRPDPRRDFVSAAVSSTTAFPGNTRQDILCQWFGSPGDGAVGAQFELAGWREPGRCYTAARVGYPSRTSSLPTPLGGLR